MLAARPLVAEGAGGIILFGSDAPPDLPANLAALQADSRKRRAPAGHDRRGRRGSPADGQPGGKPALAADHGRHHDRGQVRVLAEHVGRRMRAAGVTMDLAPVLDLSDGPGPDAADPDGPRSFSIRGPVATAYGLAFAQGLQDGGVIPVVKHFPGLGQASYNTDFGPASDPPLSVLQAGALRPFEAAIGAGLPAVMVGNVSIPGPDRRASRHPVHRGHHRVAAAPARVRGPRPNRLPVRPRGPGRRRQRAAGCSTRDRGRRRHGALRQSGPGSHDERGHREHRRSGHLGPAGQPPGSTMPSSTS